jgi:antitoxin component YwqK of YwqJK toxin-antitoxin module
MHLLRKHIIKLSTVGVVAVSIKPFIKIKDEYTTKKNILFELDNRHKENNKYSNEPAYIINRLYKENSNIDIDKLINSDNIIKTICNIPPYILFKPIQIYKNYHMNNKLYDTDNTDNTYDEDYKNNNTYGTIKEYYTNGQLKRIFGWEDGKKNGIYKEYYENRKPKVICNFEDDKKNGIYKQYYEEGQLNFICNYKDGALNGKHKSYYASGQLFHIVTFVNNKMNGESKKYYKNGQLKEISTYTDNKMNGEYKSYYETGRLFIICSFIDGEVDRVNIDREFKIYDMNGKLIEY